MSAGRCSVVAILLAVAIAGPVTAQLTDDRVRGALEEGVRYLRTKQRANGSWPDFAYGPTYVSGVTSLVTLAMLNAGVEPSDPAIRRSLQYLRGLTLRRTYTVAMQTLVLCAAEPERDLKTIQTNVAWLVAAQRKGQHGAKAGAWGYEKGEIDGDPSNAQFALLALYEAERVGVTVPPSTWRLALKYWTQRQRNDGSFAYRDNPDSPSTGSMTCAGIGSMIIAGSHVTDLDASITADGRVQCCGSVTQNDTDLAIDNAFQWLGRHFTSVRNPGGGDFYYHYYMYALERVGRLAGRRFIGQHDWYRAGAESLVRSQDPVSGYWHGKVPVASTAFAVLFLSKGRRPVLMSKIRRAPGEDWNHHRHDVAQLTRHVERRWKQDLTWQVVDLAQADAQDLWQSPVLFISGRAGLDIAMEEKAALKEYVSMGGFVFAESCDGVPGCDGQGFDRDFRQLMRELFPDSQLAPLPKDHPIWFAEQKVNPDYLRPLEGIQQCCRTGVVYSPVNLSCYWELASKRRIRDRMPEKVRDEIDACLALGANVVTYATGRELRRKLDNSGFVSIVKQTKPQNRASFYVAKLRHNGGDDDAPVALSNMLGVLAEQTQLPVAVEKRLLGLRDPQLANYPVAFVHGRRGFRWSQQEIRALREYIQRGGVIFADAICADSKFASSFRAAIQAAFPDTPLQRIPPQHPMFTDAFHGHDVRAVSLREPVKRANQTDRHAVRTRRVAPLLEGIQWKGRYVVLFSPHDLSCALENQPSLECKGYTREDAARIATNVLLYAMQQ